MSERETAYIRAIEAVSVLAGMTGFLDMLIVSTRRRGNTTAALEMPDAVLVVGTLTQKRQLMSEGVDPERVYCVSTDKMSMARTIKGRVLFDVTAVTEYARQATGAVLSLMQAQEQLQGYARMLSTQLQGERRMRKAGFRQLDEARAEMLQQQEEIVELRRRLAEATSTP